MKDPAIAPVLGTRRLRDCNVDEGNKLQKEAFLALALGPHLGFTFRIRGCVWNIVAVVSSQALTPLLWTLTTAKGTDLKVLFSKLLTKQP